MGPTWVLSAPDGPHVGPKNFIIREDMYWQCGNKSLCRFPREKQTNKTIRMIYICMLITHSYAMTEQTSHLQAYHSAGKRPNNNKNTVITDSVARFSYKKE